MSYLTCSMSPIGMAIVVFDFVSATASSRSVLCSALSKTISVSPSRMRSPVWRGRSRSTRMPLRNVPFALPQFFSTQAPFTGAISACLRERYRSLIGMVQSDARPIDAISPFSCWRVGEARGE